MEGTKKKIKLWVLVIVWGTAVIATCTPPPKTETTPSTAANTAVHATASRLNITPSNTPTITPSPTAHRPTAPPPSPTLHSPPPNPQSGSLLFSSRRIDTNGDGAMQPPDGIHIYAINLQNRKVTRLTDGDFYDTDPSWSPNGTQIAFVSTRSGNVDLFVMDASGDNVQQLSHTNERVRHPAWSPDGRHIAFSGGDFNAPAIFLLNVASGELRQLTEAAASDIRPEWSPNGRFLAFERTFANNAVPPVNTEQGIHLLDIDAGTLILPSQLLLAEQQPQHFHQPQWLPGQAATLSVLQETSTGSVLRLFQLDESQLALDSLPLRIEHVVDYTWTDDHTLLGVFQRGETTDIAMLSLDLSKNGVLDFDPAQGTAVSLTNDAYIESNPDWHR